MSVEEHRNKVLYYMHADIKQRGRLHDTIFNFFECRMQHF